MRSRLLAQGQVLELPALVGDPSPAKRTGGVDPATLRGITLDDADAELAGLWKRGGGV